MGILVHIERHANSFSPFLQMEGKNVLKLVSSGPVAKIKVIWTALVVLSLLLSSYGGYQSVNETARIEARAHAGQLLNTRHWAASIGGVYALVTPKTPPNPFLEGRVAERDIVTPLGRDLTLLNPAYMTRLISESLVDDMHVHARLVSLEPVNKTNTADPWESTVLNQFEHRTQSDYIEVDKSTLHDEPHMRYMKALYLEPACMQCHSEQGDIGDLRGAISVSIPMGPHYLIMQRHITILILVHAFIYIIGLIAIYTFGKKISTTLGKLAQSQSLLSEAQSVAHIGSWRLDHINKQLEWSDEIYVIFGVNKSEFTPSYEHFIEKVHSEDRDEVATSFELSMLDKDKDYDVTHRIVRMNDGEIRYVRERCKHNYDSEGNVIASVGTAQDMTRSVAAEKKVHRLAYYDAHSNLPNEALFSEFLSKALEQGEFGFAASLELMNIGEIASIAGIDQTRELIDEIGIKLSANVNPESLVAKSGRRLFQIVYICDECEKEELTQVAERLYRLAQEPLEMLGTSISMDVSMGVFPFSPEVKLDRDTVVTRAEIALHHALHSYHSRLSFYNPSMQHRISHNREIIIGIREALDNNIFKIYYQPQVNLKSKQVVGCEALIRWPVGGGDWMSPAVFIPVAEQSELIGEISKYTVTEVCRTVSNWHHQHGYDIKCSVNVSAVELMSDEFILHMKSAVDKFNVPVELLGVEITETALMGNINRAQSTLRKIADMGISIAIDDFGTGHSSMAYLKKLPINKLKIDRVFIVDAPHDSTDKKIVESIISLARALGHTVIAEGAEEQSQIDTLISLGCDEVQGNATGHPMPEDEFVNLLRQS